MHLIRSEIRAMTTQIRAHPKNLTFLNLSRTSSLKELPKFLREFKDLSELNVHESGIDQNYPPIPEWLSTQLPKLRITLLGL